MDTEEGVEVVWNEVRFSEKKYFNSKEETICEVFDRLILLNHPNIVKLHKYWIDKDAEKARIIFITEYMSSGSVKLFLKKTKKNEIKMSLEVSWSKQIIVQQQLLIQISKFLSSLGNVGASNCYPHFAISIRRYRRLFMRI